MNTMELSVYSEFLESCCMCDSEHTEINVIKREALGDLSFSYDQLAIHCQDCDFSFVNNELSAITLRNRNEAEEAALRRIEIDSLKRKINTSVIVVGRMKRRSTSASHAVFNRVNSYTALNSSFEEVETIHTHSTQALHTTNEGMRSYKYIGR